MSRPSKTKSFCAGCRNNFYNGNNSIGIKECWSYKSARMVRRWKIGWWTMPLSPKAFREVYTLNCHHAPGQYAMYDKPHADAVEPVHLTKKGANP